MNEESVIQIPERFDFSFNKQFTSAYQPLIEAKQTKCIILDFSRVNYLDSSALGMMVLAQKKAQAANIKTKVRGARGAALEVLELAHMDRLYEY